jgi:hypothetical protein
LHQRYINFFSTFSILLSYISIAAEVVISKFVVSSRIEFAYVWITISFTRSNVEI